jgi:hypothetical protein
MAFEVTQANLVGVSARRDAHEALKGVAQAAGGHSGFRRELGHRRGGLDAGFDGPADSADQSGFGQARSAPGPAAATGAETLALCFSRRVKEDNLPAPGQARRAGRQTVDAGGADGIDKGAVQPRVS